MDEDISFTTGTLSIDLENIIQSTEGLIKRKEESISVDLDEYTKQLEKIQIIKENYSTRRLEGVREDVILRFLQLHNRALALKWQKLASEIRSLALMFSQLQNQDIIEQVIEMLLNSHIIHEEVYFHDLILGSNFDLHQWIKKGGKLTLLANCVRKFKITRVALDIMYFVLKDPRETDTYEVIEKEFNADIMDFYLRLTKNKEQTFVFSIWEAFNKPKYYPIIKQLSPEVKLDWIIFLVQHYDSLHFEEKYYDIFTSLVEGIDISLLPRAFRPARGLKEHFFMTVMRNGHIKTFDFLIKAGYNFLSFKKKCRAFLQAIHFRNNYCAKALLKTDRVKFDEIELSDDERQDLIFMKDFELYQLMHKYGYDFTKSPLVSHPDHHVDYPFLNALMDWHLSKCHNQVLSLKRLCAIEIKAKCLSYERLPIDLQELIEEYNDPLYWLNWNEDKANKMYWKELARYLWHTRNRRQDGEVLFKLKTIGESLMHVVVVIQAGYARSFYKAGFKYTLEGPGVKRPFSWNEENEVIAQLGLTNDFAVLQGILAVLARKPNAERDKDASPTRPLWTVYNPDLKWNFEALPKWFSHFLKRLVNSKPN